MGQMFRLRNWHCFDCRIVILIIFHGFGHTIQLCSAKKTDAVINPAQSGCNIAFHVVTFYTGINGFWRSSQMGCFIVSINQPGINRVGITEAAAHKILSKIFSAAGYIVNQSSCNGKIQNQLIKPGIFSRNQTAGEQRFGIDQKKPVKELRTIAAGHDSNRRGVSSCRHIGAVTDF